MYRIRRIFCVCLALFVLLSLTSACTLRPTRPDAGAELALDNGQALGYDLSVIADAAGKEHLVAELVYFYDGQLYETGALALQAQMENIYRIVVYGKGSYAYREFVFSDGSRMLPIEPVVYDTEAGVCYISAALPERFDPENAVLETRKADEDAQDTQPQSKKGTTTKGSFPVGETQGDYKLSLREDFYFISRTRVMTIEGSVSFQDTFEGWHIAYSEARAAYVLKDREGSESYRICLEIDGEDVAIPNETLKENRVQMVDGKLTGFTFSFPLGDRFSEDSEVLIFLEAL